MGTTAKRYKANVVIFDDDTHFVRDYKNQLERDGYQVELLDSLRDLPPVLNRSKHADASFFIVDMMMPGQGIYADELTDKGFLTGICVASDLRAAYPVIPIIIWTGSALAKVQENATRHARIVPMCRYCQKSEEPAALSDALDYYLLRGAFKNEVFKKIWNTIAKLADLRGLLGG